MKTPRQREPASNARTPAEAVVELRPPRPLAEVVESLLRPAAALRRDVRALGGALVVRDGHVLVGGEAFALRPGAARQFRALAGVPGRSPTVELGSTPTVREHRALLVRLDGREVRAVLGASFVPLDDLDVFTRIARAIDAMGWADDLLVSFVGTGERMTVVRAVLRSSRVEVRPSDEFLRGVMIVNSEVGAAAFSLTPLVTRLACWNVSIASGPTLRLVHAGAAHRLDRDWRKEIARTLDAARVMLDGWRSSPSFAAANAITEAAKSRSLARRIAEERRAQRLVEDAGLRDPR